MCAVELLPAASFVSVSEKTFMTQGNVWSTVEESWKRLTLLASLYDIRRTVRHYCLGPTCFVSPYNEFLLLLLLLNDDVVVELWFGFINLKYMDGKEMESNCTFTVYPLVQTTGMVYLVGKCWQPSTKIFLKFWECWPFVWICTPAFEHDVITTQTNIIKSMMARLKQVQSRTREKNIQPFYIQRKTTL